MIEKIRKLEQRILKLEEWFILIALACIVFFQIMQVVFRYILSSPIGWVDEYSRFLFIWMIMIGSAVAVQKIAHFNVEFLVEKFNLRIQWLTNVVVTILSSSFVIILIVAGFRYLVDMKGKVSSATGVPIEILNFAIPVGFTLMAMHLLFNIILKNKKEELPVE
ncbi:TRAP transporter small permease [Psychrobacillus soli]|uniref:TRAP transporter small permease n=1 Tax=Psychrobacillus soli TaxID=1543965 RepID=A0A544TDJ3_9BACI|nr:TRAP transporter small permease [Psychrobacillus soli]TQR15537.1 TRAP transporter small permease [Psychrobacillus soli]